MQTPYSGRKTYFARHAFEISENVYEPAEDSFLLAEKLSVNPGESVLDMGTGCGLLGIVAADTAEKVVAVDINPHAVRCARANAISNGVNGKMLFVQGDLFAPLHTGMKFDLILFNAPYLPSENLEDKSWLEHSWSGGRGGREVIDRFIDEAPLYLKQHGRILLVQSTLTDVDETAKKLSQKGFRVHTTAKRDMPFFETIVLIEAQR